MRDEEGDGSGCSDVEWFEFTAGGGSSKASCSGANLEPSWPLISVDEAGVGSEPVRGTSAAVRRGMALDLFGMVGINWEG